MTHFFNILSKITFFISIVYSFKITKKKEKGLKQRFGHPAWSVLRNIPFGKYHSLWKTAQAGHLTMWDVGFWIVVAGSQENTQRRRQWLSHKNTAVYLFTTGTQTPKHIYKKPRDLNPKIISTYTRVIPTPKQRNILWTKLKLLKQTRSNCVAQVSSRTLSQLLAACSVCLSNNNECAF